MTWVNRYVSGVARYLPRRIREDVSDELRSILEDKIEEARNRLGRPLEESEVVSVLKDFGHPLEVASQYQNRGALVSESLFPIYLQALKSVTLLFVLLALVWIGVGASGTVSAWPDLSSAAVAFAFLLCVVGMTVAFHVWGRRLEHADVIKGWNPESLPPDPPDKSFVSLPESLMALVLTVGWFAILSAISHAATLAGHGSALYSWDALTFSAGHRGAAVLLWLKIHAIGSFAIYATLLFSPYWSRTKRVFSAAGCYLLALIFVMAMVGVHGAIRFCGETDLCGPFNENVPYWAQINLGIAAAVAFAIGSYDVYYAFKMRSSSGLPAEAHTLTG